MPPADAPHATILYQYFHPDDVVSARHLSDLAAGLAARGWVVTAVPANRSCRDDTQVYPPRETWNGVEVERVWRPGWRQSSNRERLLIVAWMLSAWGLRAVAAPRYRREVLVIGTDPFLSVLVALPWKLFHRRARVAHWAFDLFPETPVAEGMVRESSPIVRGIRVLLRAAYRQCGLIADLGPCMAARLKPYGSPARPATLTPWALVEPAAPVEFDPETRRDLFGDARLGLLYSGNLGYAHAYDEFLELARVLRNDSVGFAFGVRGHRAAELKAAVTPDDTNVRFAGFAPEAVLEKRLGACDLHLVSLRPPYTGTVVPSKFFGALATGRGVLFAGSPDSAIAEWIRRYDVGYVLTPGSVPAVAEKLRKLAADPGELLAMRERCHAVYREHFSRASQLDRWDRELRRLLPA